MDTPSTPKKEKKGLGRMWNKVKLAIRSKSKSKSKATAQTAESSNPLQGQPTQTTQRYSQQNPLGLKGTDQDSNQIVERESTTLPVVEDPPPTMPSTKPVQADPVTHAAEDVPSGPTAADVEPAVMAKEETTQPLPVREMSSREKEDLARRYERAQAIFKKYNLELDDASWEMHPKIQVERVLKPARIRVRWTCHECKTTFGHDKICAECAHPQCKSCSRYPPKKKKKSRTKKAPIAAATTDLSGPDIRQGACHECQTAFDLGSQECTNCHHKICERCLQETLSVVEAGENQAITAT